METEQNGVCQELGAGNYPGNRPEVSVMQDEYDLQDSAYGQQYYTAHCRVREEGRSHGKCSYCDKINTQINWEALPSFC